MPMSTSPTLPGAKIADFEQRKAAALILAGEARQSPPIDHALKLALLSARGPVGGPNKWASSTAYAVHAGTHEYSVTLGPDPEPIYAVR